MKEFKINEFITLKLEESKTIIYVNDKKFDQCKSLLWNIPVDMLISLDEVESIDEVAERLDNELEESDDEIGKISPEAEFWAHCSNLQVWCEHNYTTNLMHRNLAFPLLKRLSEVGDPIAKIGFKEEIAKRLNNGCPSVVNYLIKEKYIDYLERDEFLNNLLTPKETEIIKELEKLINKEFEILHDPKEYKRNSITVQKKHIIMLDIYKCNLKNFPEVITNLKELKDLFIRKTNLNSIARNIKNLTSLQTLDLSSNKIKSLPYSIGDLEELKDLILEKNKIKSLPESIGKLRNLKSLNLNDNYLLDIPKSIMNLTSIESISLINNEFEEIPKLLGEIGPLKYLYLSNAKFKKIPNSIKNKKYLSIKLR